MRTWALEGKLGQSERVALTYIHYQMQNRLQWEAAASHREISSVLCYHLEGWDREGGREVQEGGDMGIYVYI